MSEGLSKTVSFKKNHRKHQVEVLVRSPPAGTVALARGGLRTPAMTASCRNQSNEIGKAELSQSQGSQTRTGIHHCSKKKKIMPANTHPVTAVGQHLWSQNCNFCIIVQTLNRMTAEFWRGRTLLSFWDNQHLALQSQSLGVRQAKLADGKYGNLKHASIAQK